ncbi:Clc-like protein [Ancylostoma caninum]|uniref:Clc-like protein n=1 Tax=Ancylostoma caninum TaxID=29170 RepID=A0A368GGC5_ANCCA|nr:Clc-like protein [Ancylostoma caninum]
MLNDNHRARRQEDAKYLSMHLDFVLTLVHPFGCWHYAVLILNVVSICLMSCGIAAAAWHYKNKERSRLSTILFSAFICLAVLTLGISLMVFVINGEMLESKYLIGVKNTFEKYYGYSFYLACAALVMLVFAAFGAILLTTFMFFSNSTSSDVTRRQVSSVTSDYNEEIQKSPQQVLYSSPNKEVPPSPMTPLHWSVEVWPVDSAVQRGERRKPKRAEDSKVWGKGVILWEERGAAHRLVKSSNWPETQLGRISLPKNDASQVHFRLVEKEES